MFCAAAAATVAVNYRDYVTYAPYKYLSHILVIDAKLCIRPRAKKYRQLRAPPRLYKRFIIYLSGRVNSSRCKLRGFEARRDELIFLFSSRKYLKGGVHATRCVCAAAKKARL